MRRHSKPIPPLTPQDITRFWSKVNKDGPIPQHRPKLGPCWVFTAALSHGYGSFGIGRSTFLAHRIAFLIGNGTIDPELRVCHACDNPACCNPAHLWQGTDLENIHDMISKDRHSRGDRNPMRLYPDLIPRGEDRENSVLTAEQVLAIRAEHVPGKKGYGYRPLAQKYGVSVTTIVCVIKRYSWDHL